jgi:capsular polysaccharide export protein
MDGERRTLPRYLVLQGMATPFFGVLARALLTRGHAVKRINFTAGDRLFWPLPGSVNYRGGLDDWPDFLEARLRAWRISDILLFGDCRPLHKAAIRLAARLGVRVHVFEEGYLRPNWITMEMGGVNGHSSLSRDPKWFLRQAMTLPPWQEGAPIRSHFLLRATWDVTYHVTSFLFGWLYPRYETHMSLHPFREYAGWIGRFLRTPASRRRARQAMARRDAWGRPYFFMPLQLDSDSQVRFHSPFPGMEATLDHVMASFARHAPAETGLVLKDHPLDPGLVNWRAVAARLAARHGLGDRVICLSPHRLDDLLRGSRGVVTLNSTVGFLALEQHIPLLTLGTAIYDMPGLTFQNGLDRFWREATAPDWTVFDAFRRVVADRTQVRGSFFSAEGIDVAVAGVILRLEQAADIHPAFAARPGTAPPGTEDSRRQSAPIAG